MLARPRIIQCFGQQNITGIHFWLQSICWIEREREGERKREKEIERERGKNCSWQVHQHKHFTICFSIFVFFLGFVFKSNTAASHRKKADDAENNKQTRKSGNNTRYYCHRQINWFDGRGFRIVWCEFAHHHHNHWCTLLILSSE